MRPGVREFGRVPEKRQRRQEEETVFATRRKVNHVNRNQLSGDGRDPRTYEP